MIPSLIDFMHEDTCTIKVTFRAKQYELYAYLKQIADVSRDNAVWVVLKERASPVQSLVEKVLTSN